MSLQGQWVNSYNSLMTIYQAPNGLISGTYSSTTGGSGTYDIVGWAGLNQPTKKAGQPLSISILWRSNDGGKSDGSHEVSALAGQLVMGTTGDLSIVLIHMFAETNPNTDPGNIPPIGVYPDKLIYHPYKPSGKPLIPINNLGIPNADQGKAVLGNWSGFIDGNAIKLNISWGHMGYCAIQGALMDTEGNTLEIYGFTDNFAIADGLTLQGITFSAYRNSTSSVYLSFTGWLDLKSGQMKLTRIAASSTPNNDLWYQVAVAEGSLYKMVTEKKTTLVDQSLDNKFNKVSTKK